jgi:nitrogenase-stabilizing/protective protein
MNSLQDRMKALSSAEDFFVFFGLTFDQAVLNVNRLHILKRFFQYRRQADGLNLLNEIDEFRCQRQLLERAYRDFVVSTPAREKVFKVFQDAGGTTHVGLAGLTQSLAGRRRELQAS